MSCSYQSFLWSLLCILSTQSRFSFTEVSLCLYAHARVGTCTCVCVHVRVCAVMCHFLMLFNQIKTISQALNRECFKCFFGQKNSDIEKNESMNNQSKGDCFLLLALKDSYHDFNIVFIGFAIICICHYNIVLTEI